MLMQSFNTMTRQLSDSRLDVELKQQQLESAKVYLESILAHLTSGVIAFDERFYVRSANPLAGLILGVDLETLKGLKLFEWGDAHPGLTDFAQALIEEFQQGSVREWEKQIDYGGKDSSQTLLVRGTQLPATIDNGYVVVFDDITRLIQAQRDAAWGEVARRLAHEIKNPLTPIQLSAERIERKLSNKLDNNDADMLHRATNTIVNQVGALKSMVDAFSEYARSPALNLKSVDLNMLVQELLVLYEQNGVPIKADLGPDVPTVEGDQTLLRQVIHNLLQNAQDALVESASPLITVRTEVENGWVKLGVMDNGVGIPEHMMARVFEPYVTTKQKGTGLGLAISKKIIDEHHGKLQIENLKPHGACVCVKLPRTIENPHEQDTCR
jgi:PAS domain S-box-containing protein